MAPRHAIDLALDLARMPALARTPVAPPIPTDVAELMRIAAANPQACQDAAAKTGQKPVVLIEAARFYLQQVLFRPDADSYRILGLEPAASRATARSHMRWLLQWLHPDRNSNMDAVYAERVLKAWRLVSATETSVEPAKQSRLRPQPGRSRRLHATSFRIPWIELPRKSRASLLRRSSRTVVMWAVPAGLAIIFLALCSALYYFGPERIAALTSFQ